MRHHTHMPTERKSKTMLHPRGNDRDQRPRRCRSEPRTCLFDSPSWPLEHPNTLYRMAVDIFKLSKATPFIPAGGVALLEQVNTASGPGDAAYMWQMHSSPLLSGRTTRELCIRVGHLDGCSGERRKTRRLGQDLGRKHMMDGWEEVQSVFTLFIEHQLYVSLCLDPGGQW